MRGGGVKAKVWHVFAFRKYSTGLDLRKFMGKLTTEAQSTPSQEGLREFLRKF